MLVVNSDSDAIFVMAGPSLFHSAMTSGKKEYLDALSLKGSTLMCTCVYDVLVQCLNCLPVHSIVSCCRMHHTKRYRFLRTDRWKQNFFFSLVYYAASIEHFVCNALTNWATVVLSLIHFLAVFPSKKVHGKTAHTYCEDVGSDPTCGKLFFGHFHCPLLYHFYISLKKEEKDINVPCCLLVLYEYRLMMMMKHLLVVRVAILVLWNGNLLHTTTYIRTPAYWQMQSVHYF